VEIIATHHELSIVDSTFFLQHKKASTLWGDMSPAKYVISLFGGVRPTARALGRDPSAVSRWATSIKKGGLGGRIPGTNHKKILQIAKRKGLDITAADLISGR